MNKYFTGVGSRDLPEEHYDLLFSASKLLSSKGYILRSGAAEGSDTACELGVDSVNGKKEIYIPWKNFNKSTSTLIGSCKKSEKMASEIHPAWEKCSKWSKVLHSRNCYQVLGKNLKTPSEVLICYTEGGEIRGGTATAIRLAQKYSVPVYNFGSWSDVEKFEKDFKIKISKKEGGIMTGYTF